MRIQLISLSLLVLTLSAGAREYKGNTKSNKQLKSLAADCLQATGSNELNINNTKALIQTGGDMWWNLAGTPKYEIPSGSGQTSLFAGSLWMGGTDVSGQLKVAAIRFRQNGTDFWPGPLNTITGEIDAESCVYWDKHFVTTRDDVAEFVAWYNLNQIDAEKARKDFPSYQIPKSILEWPAHGREYDPYNEDHFLAPFIDVDGDQVYNPLQGDYPGYDLNNQFDCKQKIANIYGDQNLWWVFNDKGNIHTETGAQAIGMEIRAQAFAFATNDEVNNMTFYNYELVNRSTFTLTETYFGQWVDADLGCAQDDYVGCDVTRGLGYCYNGDAIDEDCRGALGYGEQPPAIGVDFFQGPFQDNDGIDNPLTQDYNQAIALDGVPYKGIGIGYGDGEADNERFGMRKFLYHNNNNQVNGDPETGAEYYNYLRSYWTDGSRMVYGGNGHRNSGGTVEADYMFPGDTDTLGWGTGGQPQPIWTEQTAGNQPFDRRFMQSAGPFTLLPGAVNNITVGVVWARAKSGGPFESVQAVRKADDKTQALFDACFKILNGPEAPILEVQELENELVLYITNPKISNNFREEYEEQDPFIIAPDNLSYDEAADYRTYKFQGYQVYQLKDASVSASDLSNNELARLISQMDIEDNITDIVNYELDGDIRATVPISKVINAANDGIKHTIAITRDAFAEGDDKLINHKTYYFMAIAYAYNNHTPYDPNDETSQTTPYIASRKAPTGAIPIAQGIPHNVQLENGGTKLNAAFGQTIQVTKTEGAGSGGQFLLIEDGEDDEIFADGDGFGKMTEITYKNEVFQNGFFTSPIEVKVVDPLNIVEGDFTIKFTDSTTFDLSDAYYYIDGDNIEDPIYSTKSINVYNEELFLDLGISISIRQAGETGEYTTPNYGFIGADMTFEDEGKPWLTGIEDTEGSEGSNWLRSGRSNAETDQNVQKDDDYLFSLVDSLDTQTPPGNITVFVDPDEYFENFLSGTWGPFALASKFENGVMPRFMDISSAGYDLSFKENQLQYLENVDVVFTNDKTKWTRCPVFELSSSDTISAGKVKRGDLRKAQSVDKDGKSAGVGSGVSTNPNDPNYISETGMGWFPGYAYNVETGERLNMAFGEASYLEAENGRDMLWNPTPNITEGPFNDVRYGGKHIIYVFRNNTKEQYVHRSYYNDQDQKVVNLSAFGAAVRSDFEDDGISTRMPAYDAGEFMMDMILNKDFFPLNDLAKTTVWRTCMWAGYPLVNDVYYKDFINEGIPTETRVQLRVSKPFRTYSNGEFISEGELLTPGKKYVVNVGPVIYQGKEYRIGATITPEVSSTFKAAFYDRNDNEVDLPLWDKVNNLIEVITDGLPTFNFSTNGLAPEVNVDSLAEAALDIIKVVPNPYYAYSNYETDKLDTRVRITNLPEKCTVKIYTTAGILVRTYKKDDTETTYIDWDLKNQSRVPISSGMYMIHVNVPGVGDRVIKWFGALRPVDLDSF